MLLELANLGSMFDFVVMRSEFSEPRDFRVCCTCTRAFTRHRPAQRFVAADYQVKASTSASQLVDRLCRD
jgi:hypothetical protein